MSDEVRAAIAKRLAELYKRDGKLTPDAVVEEAKSKESVLHECFEWNTTSAAMEHWREQARTLIRSIRIEIVIEEVSIAVPVYVRDPDAESDEQSYAAVSRLRSNKEQAQAALMYELERAEAALWRARKVAAALGLEKDMDKLMAQFGRVKKRATK